jgi:hypothetical protein
MKKHLLFIGILGLSLITFAQTPSLQWVKQLPNCGDYQGNYGGSCVKVDSKGNVYTSGYFSGTVDFDPGAGTAIFTSLGNSDMFISKLDASGNFVWAKQIGGLYNDLAYGIALDGAGNVYATGSFMGTVDFDPGAGVANLDGLGLAFILKLDASGNYVWAKKFTAGSSTGYSVAIDASNNVYSIGRFMGTVDFDPGSATTNLTSPGVGTGQIYISKLDASGNFVWAKQMGGDYDDYGLSIVLDAQANVYTTGHFSDVADFDPGVGVFNLTTLPGSNEIFISKLNSKGEFLLAKQMGGPNGDRGHSITLDASGNIITTGYFFGTADFDPGTGIANEVAIGSKHVFISKLDASGNYVWVKNIGTAAGYSDMVGNAVVTDAAGNIYVTGYFNANTDFDPGAGTAFSNSNGNDDIFILKLNASGNYVWHQKIGGTTWDSGKSIFVDNLDNIYTTGFFKFTADFDPGAPVVNLTTSNAGNGDVFISKLSQRTTAINSWGMDNSVKMNVYPNPFTTQTNIVFSEMQKNSTIRIVDILGKEIRSIHFSGDRLTLEKGNMKKGIYFIQAIDVARNISIQKLILQ